VGAVVSHLREIGLIDDLNYARLWVRSRVKTNPRGALLLRKELRTKGVAADVIEKALEEFKEAYDEIELLSRLAESRARKLTHLDRRTRQRRLFNYLLRRGFPIDEVRSITRRY
jgi:regulatory protein